MKRRSSKQRASVLIIVLWITVGLAVIALTFAQTSMMSYQGADNELAGQQAEWAVEGGARYVMSLLSNTTTATPGQMLDPTSYQSEALPLGEATFWILGGAGDDSTYSSTRPIFGLVDEASKINLNMEKTLLQQILPNVPGMTPDLEDAIYEWTDASNKSGSAGAQAYASHSPAYANKSAPFESLEEMALLNGATHEILYGEDANMNGVLDPNEDDGEESAPADNADGKLEPGVLSFFTCFSRETGMASDGSPRVDGKSIGDPNLLNLIQIQSQMDTATATAVVTALRLYASPISKGQTGTFTSLLELYGACAAAGMTAAQFDSIYDKLWMAPAGNKGYVDGLINVNTATEAVLSCVPGISSNASAVIAERSKQTPGSPSITWLLPVLGPQGAIQAGPFVTGRSYQVSADIAAVGRHGRGYRRARFVIDTTTATPRIIYRRDLSSLGWALGSDARQTLATRKEMAP